MTKLDKLEEVVRGLDRKELAVFRNWFQGFLGIRFGTDLDQLFPAIREPGVEIHLIAIGRPNIAYLRFAPFGIRGQRHGAVEKRVL